MINEVVEAGRKPDKTKDKRQKTDQEDSKPKRSDLMSARDNPKVPTFEDLMWPALKALNSMGGSASNEELLAKVIELEGIPESIQNIMHVDNRRTKVDYNLAWAKTYLKRVGAMDNSTRGIWSITKNGESMTEKDCQEVRKKARFLRHSEKKYTHKEEQLVDETATINDQTVDDRWKDALLQELRKMPPPAFERLSQRLLREAGFIRVEVTGRSGDGGIDGVGVLRINLLSFQIRFQCKRYQGSVGSGDVRDFRGAMVGRGDKGLMITTGTFSSEARKEASRDGAPAIDLIDGNALCNLLKDLKLGVDVKMVERVDLDPDWFSKV